MTQRSGVEGPIDVVDPDGQPVEGVEWRTVEQAGRRLMNLENYTQEG